jgi:uncharacterized protein (DUF1800 family)
VVTTPAHLPRGSVAAFSEESVSATPVSSNPKARAALALHRFGFGPRPGGIDALASDPRGAVLAELKRGAGRITDPELPSGPDAARSAFNFVRQRLAKGEQAAGAAPPKAGEMAKDGDKPDGMQAATPGMKANAPAADEPKPGPIPLPQQLYLNEAKARYQAALSAEVGFAERLVWFWSNHFCISADKGPVVRALAGAYEREAIRPHVLGKFSDMLLAVETHPGTLIYLDNARSIGPDSTAGVRQGKGLNENLAREILELHTLGVRTGYTQQDVTSFANIITGWTIVPLRQDPENGGSFTFNPRMHQPGAQTVLGKRYAEDAFRQGEAVLQNLARHPATARHIAGKLATHFVADEPPPALVDRLAKRFLDTDGDLLEVSKTLVAAPEAWAAPRAKLKKPGEWLMATIRTCGIEMKDARRAVNSQNLLGEPLWRPSAPKGFSDDSAAWLDGLAQRLDIANVIARRIGNDLREPDEMVDAALGPLASTETRQTIQRAESRPQALALLLMAPEFQRR